MRRSATLEQLEDCGEQNARGLLMLLARIYRQTRRMAEAAGTRAAAAQHARHQHVARGRDGHADLSGSTEGGRRSVADRKELASAWKATPKSLARRAEVVVAYARAAMACDDHEAAEAELRALLERAMGRSRRARVRRTGTGRTVHDARTRRTVAARASRPMLRCCSLVRGCRCEAELYGKARSYLETSIAIRPAARSVSIARRLMEQLGERERAIRRCTMRSCMRSAARPSCRRSAHAAGRIAGKRIGRTALTCRTRTHHPASIAADPHRRGGRNDPRRGATRRVESAAQLQGRALFVVPRAHSLGPRSYTRSGRPLGLMAEEEREGYALLCQAHATGAS